MIKSWEEAGEVLAEFENRISYLEHSANRTQVNNLEERIIEIERLIKSLEIPEWTKRQWDVINQLKGQMLHLQKELNTHLDKKKKDSY